MSANAEINAISNIGDDLEDKYARLNEVYEGWFDRTNGGEINLAEAIIAAQNNNDTAGLLRQIEGYLVMLVDESDSETPIAAYGRARAATANFVANLPPNITEDELIELFIHEVRQAIDNPLQALTQPRDEEAMPDTQNPVISQEEAQAELNRPNHQLDEAELYRLVSQAQQGDEKAMHTLWIDAIPLAKAIANQYRNRASIDDNTETALLVVPGVVSRYDPQKGGSYSLLLRRRMIGSILDAERKYYSDMGLKRNDHGRIKRARDSDDPNKRLHELTQPSEYRTGKLKPGFAMAGHLVLEGMIVSRPMSLDKSMHGEDASKAVPGVEPVADTNVQEEALLNIEAARIRKYVNQLPDRERQVIILYYGLFDSPILNLREIGESMGVTLNRIGQIHTRALKKIFKLYELDDSSIEGLDRFADVAEKPADIWPGPFLQRIYRKLEKYRDVALSEAETQTVLKHVKKWDLQKIPVDGKTYYLLQRTLLDGLPNDMPTFPNNEEDRRKVGRRNGIHSVLVDEVHGSDLQFIIDLEQFLCDTGKDYLSEFSKSLTNREREIVANLFKPNGQLAFNLEISESVVRTHIKNAMSKHDLHRVNDLAVLAVSEGLIDLESVPAERTIKLTDRQIALLRHCYNKDRTEGAKVLKITVRTYSELWPSIYLATGAQTQVQAILMAMKDGLIPKSSQP